MLREAIAARYGLNADRIVCGAGSDELLNLLANAYLLNLLYLAIGFSSFMIAFRSARKHGLLLQVGE